MRAIRKKTSPGLTASEQLEADLKAGHELVNQHFHLQPFLASSALKLSCGGCGELTRI